jgi:hypothetical protein
VSGDVSVITQKIKVSRESADTPIVDILDKLKSGMVFMSSVSSVSASIQAVNTALVSAVNKSVASAEKMMKFAVASTVGAEMGKGQEIDLSA